ncbi:Phytochelatin synthase [Chlamydoabsidia padenii]|nr:Phytochelatin synthase [Chlamydoabsidia padenii]
MENQTTLPTLTPFTSHEGKALFRGALNQGQTESFFKLLGNFTSQPSPHLAGISSLTMALNALEIDPKTIWKGNWRWYSGDQLKPCSPSERVTEYGIPFDEFTCLAQLHCSVSSFRVNYARPSYDQFLHTLQQVTSDASSQLVVHYSRSVLGQKGRQHQDAHYSPIGAHNATKEQTLIMDVDRVQHPSVWVPTRDLYRAMLKSDPVTGLSRGYFVLKQGKTSQRLKCQGCTNRTCRT